MAILITKLFRNGLVEDLKDIDKFALRSQNGVTLTVGQVGHAADANAIQTNLVLIDGKPQVYVPVYRQPGANSLQVVDQVREAITRLEKSMDGFKMAVVSDQSVFIRRAIEAITHEALIGGGFAAIMVLLFLGSLRATFAVLLSLPLSLGWGFRLLKVNRANFECDDARWTRALGRGARGQRDRCHRSDYAETPGGNVGARRFFTRRQRSRATGFSFNHFNADRIFPRRLFVRGG